MSVNYAAEVRRFLLERFASVDLVLSTERVFPGVLEEVVLLMAEGYQQGPTDHANVYQVQNAAELARVPASRTWRPLRPEDKMDPRPAPHRRPHRLQRTAGEPRVHRAGDLA